MLVVWVGNAGGLRRWHLRVTVKRAEARSHFGRFVGASSRFGHLRAPQIEVSRNLESNHGNSQSPLVTEESAGWLESGRRESNPRSQLGKLMFCR